MYSEAIMYEPMKIHASTDKSLLAACNSGKYFAQLKKDGCWYQFERHTGDNVYLFSRTTSKKTGYLAEKGANVPHIIEALKCLPPHTILIGEIYYPNQSSKNTVSIMGCLSDKAIDRQNGEYGFIHYYIHDILMYNGIDFVQEHINNEMRYKVLEKVFEKYNLGDYDFLDLAEVWYDNLYQRVGDALAAGEEGMVLKQIDGLYEPGKRPQSNLKAKRITTLDCIIIGFEEPIKEYYGKDIQNWIYWIDNQTNQRLEITSHFNENNAIAVTKPYYYHWNNTRIKIGAYDKYGTIYDIGVIHSGISDELKEDMSINPEKYLHQVCEIQAMEVDKKEKTLRHGFLLRIRKDKNPTDCLIEDIFK